MKTINAQELLMILPHRYPFLMIDRVLNYDEQTIEAIKNFTINEPFAQGHFPGNPIMPGVMMIEAMAQASTVLAFKYIESNQDITKYFKSLDVLFSSADDVKFKQVVRPGDQLHIISNMIRNARNLFEFEARVEVENIIVAQARLKAVVGM
jgi:3-hydroxyacyl-[acyl-carrier-protein] dehydratase